MFLIFFPLFANACPSEDQMRQSIFAELFLDNDVVYYVCVENKNCDLEEFKSKLQVSQENFNNSSKGSIEALLVEPINKYKQYFSAVYFKDKCTYRLVFYPDVTLSGISILKRSYNDVRLIRTVEIESSVKWQEFEYGYSKKSKNFILLKKRLKNVE
ncbi:hypothetical protein ACFQNF_03900 [Iodobacter arcticus]|uniref:Lipoprotein n=1 Tax=Iodobacter arcticus TaxID=590593 RepID=A0ABW2QVP0_9NEIS